VSGADASLADLMLSVGGVIRRQIEVSRDVRIVSYDAATQTASIQPWTNDPELQPDGTVTGTVLPVVAGVPVRWPWGGGRALTWGLAAGDRAVAVFRTVSHDEVDSGAECPVTPASLRRWSWADVWVEPGGAVPEDPAPARTDGQPALTMPSGEALHVGDANASHELVRNDLLRTNLQNIKTALDTIAAAAGVANSYVLSATKTDRVKVDS
jgi:hypothetical protein